MAEPFLGEIRLFAGNFPPAGWAFCDGQVLQISQYDALYALIGTTYGGDGQETFALPDLRGRIPLHMGQNPATGTTYPLGLAAGAETVTLTVNQMPQHTHAVNASSESGTLNSPSNGVWAAKIQEFSTNAPDGAMNQAAISSIGGNQPHDNMMPYTVLSFIIALEGIFPTQN